MTNNHTLGTVAKDLHGTRWVHVGRDRWVSETSGHGFGVLVAPLEQVEEARIVFDGYTEEPTKLGAVVVSGTGSLYLKNGDMWVGAADKYEYFWNELPKPLTVLFEGVDEEDTE